MTTNIVSTMVDYNDTYSDDFQEDQRIMFMIRYIKFFSFAVILPLGLIANATALVVFCVSHLKKTSTGHYLVALTVSDFAYLTGEFMLWFSEYVDGRFMVHGYVHETVFMCKFVFSLRYTGRLLSAWLTVIITTERFVAIAYPLHVAAISTPTKAKVTLLILIPICVGVASFPVYTLTSNNGWCVPYNTKRTYDVMFRLVLVIGELLLPSAIVCIFTSLIIWKLSLATRNRRQSTQGFNRSTTSRRVQESQITAILLAIALTFLLFRLPQLLFYYLNDMENGQNVIYARTYEISYILFALNYCTNFIYYCAFGSSFRTEFLKFCCGKKPSNRRFSNGTMTSRMSSRMSKTISSEPLKHIIDHDTNL